MGEGLGSLLTKERDSVTDKSSKLAEKAEERRGQKTRETGSEDTSGTRKGRSDTVRGSRMIGKRTKETGGAGRGTEMSKLGSHRQKRGVGDWGGWSAFLGG